MISRAKMKIALDGDHHPQLKFDDLCLYSDVLIAIASMLEMVSEMKNMMMTTKPADTAVKSA